MLPLPDKLPAMLVIHQERLYHELYMRPLLGCSECFSKSVEKSQRDILDLAKFDLSCASHFRHNVVQVICEYFIARNLEKNVVAGLSGLAVQANSNSEERCWPGLLCEMLYFDRETLVDKGKFRNEPSRCSPSCRNMLDERLYAII